MTRKTIHCVCTEGGYLLVIINVPIHSTELGPERFRCERFQGFEFWRQGEYDKMDCDISTGADRKTKLRRACWLASGLDSASRQRKEAEQRDRHYKPMHARCSHRGRSLLA